MHDCSTDDNTNQAISLKALCLAEKQLFFGLSPLLIKLEEITPTNMDKGND